MKLFLGGGGESAPSDVSKPKDIGDFHHCDRGLIPTIYRWLIIISTQSYVRRVHPVMDVLSTKHCRFSRVLQFPVVVSDGPFWTSRENSSELRLIELSSLNIVKLVHVSSCTITLK